MMEMSIGFIFHLTLVLVYGYGINTYLFGLNPPEEILKLRTIGYGPFKYLTFWDMLLQFTYFSLALLNDLLGYSARKRSRMRDLQDFLFSTIVFAIGSFVTVSFWTLYNIDRNLIFPEIFDGWFPTWLNHNVHTTPLLGVLMESYLELHSFPKRSKGFGMVALFSLVYLIWVCFIAYQSGHWVYPVLAYLSLPSRTLFIIAMAMLISLIYLVGENFNKRLWGTAIYQVKQKEN
ncbi:androgen-induced gene 1 protein-like isoform X2 [Eriocheir sinensis]|uniref:androgen-induced gene 1 protein-like isoform X2 n=1 Tax=Eriocheir sinensis TaxID=95602 RepID=UPI0021C80616|nr:androgen-induced gene 1 protein-like isoform X2 [Eriocheir sinensis]